MAPGAAALPEPDQAKASGPTVWLDMDQQALDDAYDQSKYALNRSQIVERYASNSDIARERLGAPRRIAYGPTANEALDLYPAASTSAPISIFVHGGAWQRGLAKNYAFAAELFVHAGAHHVVLDFINVIEAGGDLMPMADQVRGAIAWVYRNAASFGGDPNRIHLYGHSSGAHLGGVAMVTDWPGLFDLPADVIKTGLLCSGMYDLRPVRLSARSRYVNFTNDMEAALSTQRHIDRFTAPVALAFGTLETPEFQRQSRDFAAALRAAGKRVELLVGSHYNHFEIVETLASPYGLLGHAALVQITGAA
ncbi:MAG TPA: alpha/beta hydrolase [Acetobacteraceae bacterium]|jgi:arylformamidase|nr:alpha/beta hydrolase [Acetobacteraceae bacterium]